ncbi:MAG: hypothetical protein OXQ89_02135 [Rhodospirillaceae bacterium]|nr:hypothetical protein [Rhodospirillaceae bacterium]MDE0362589.1 hypothetical protein [Rhodospirillaceae bacterium]
MIVRPENRPIIKAEPNKETDSLPSDSASPPESAVGWIQLGFQQVNGRIDHLDRRLRRIETTVWVATGCVIATMAIAGYAASLAHEMLLLWMQP